MRYQNNKIIVIYAKHVFYPFHELNRINYSYTIHTNVPYFTVTTLLITVIARNLITDPRSLSLFIYV